MASNYISRFGSCMPVDRERQFHQGNALPFSIANSFCVLALLMVAMDAHCANLRAPEKPAGTYPFSLDTLLVEAKRRSAIAYAPQRNSTPSWLEKLNAEQYRSIRFNPDADIWADLRLPFRLELLPVGFNFLNAVTVSVIDDGVAQDLVATPAMYEIGPQIQVPQGKTTLPLSGFRVRSHINTNKFWDEFLVFRGASYLRAVARHQLYGLSARGLAINTAEPGGEEFPAFTHFWIELPGSGATQLVIYALLESESTTGVYRFSVKPGAETIMDVDVTLFPRAEPRLIGIAPLTSMFLFDETNRGRLDDYRPEVHDSDGLQIASKSGEQIWRPLANPAKLQVSTFTTQAPHGFGLVQRSRQPGDYEDLDAQYERRPSAWIEPMSEWGPGAVELVEIPSERETNDNIVTFWRPALNFPPGHASHFAYRITWNDEPKLPKSLGKTVATRSGSSLDGKRRAFLIDFVGAGEKVEGLRLELSGSAGKISNVALVSNAAIHGLRVSFELDPNNAELIELHLRVMRADRAVTETWLYKWTAS
jgi:glucans biosynthesis protein